MPESEKPHRESEIRTSGADTSDEELRKIRAAAEAAQLEAQQTGDDEAWWNNEIDGAEARMRLLHREVVGAGTDPESAAIYVAAQEAARVHRRMEVRSQLAILGAKTEVHIKDHAGCVAEECPMMKGLEKEGVKLLDYIETLKELAPAEYNGSEPDEKSIATTTAEDGTILDEEDKYPRHPDGRPIGHYP